MSVMNLKDENEFLEKIREAKITSDVLMVNQLTEKSFTFSVISKGKELYSYNEKGSSNSRNRLLDIASGDICIFADDDVIYYDNYEETIINAYNKNKKADGILFYLENKNTKREKNKRIGNKKINALDIIKDFAQITKLQQEYANLLNSYNQYEKEKQDHITNLRLIDKSKEEQPIKESLLPYLLEAADNGRIYINENNLVIEINNNSLSKPTFICTIHINHLLEWLENINYSFEDYSLKVG